MTKAARSLVCMWLVAMAACASEADVHECSTGILCAAPLQCAAAQQICITNDCGNGVVDPGEQCDDGNIINGDGCSSTCKKEFCGNGTVDPGEECDPPGSVTNGIPCSATCQFEVCGNGVIDHDTHPAEQCDDGSANTNTPCPTPAYSNPPATCSTCTESCTIQTVEGPYCGDGICETAAGETITTCNEDCSGCGNGILDPGEECDDGAANTNTPCTAPAYNNPPNTCSTCTKSCTIDTVVGPYCGDGTCNGTETKLSCPADCAGCGNGLIQGTEQCDDGSGNTGTACATPGYANPPATCSTCTLSCTIDTVEGPYCGDGVCNGPETKTSCPMDCAGCGNGIVQGTEQCDDGSKNTDQACTITTYANPPDTCSYCTSQCDLLTVDGPYCGDGICQAGDEDITSCPEDCSGCGNGIVQGTEECDDGVNNTNTACTVATYANPPDTCSYCNKSCDLIVVQGPSCGDGTCETADETPTTCPVDCSGCGDGVLEGTEQCDNGEANTNTACATPSYHNPPLSCSTCTTSCTLDTVIGPYCGDGTCNGTETVTTCPADCAGCGNGIVQGTEECDNGAANTNMPCTVADYNNPPLTCSFCNESCDLITVLGPYCGDGIKNGTEDCDGNDGTVCPTMGQTGAICTSQCKLIVTECM